MKKITYLIIGLFLFSCSPKSFKTKWTEDKAPEYFKARFETTRGNFDIEARREWTPEGVDRLYQLIKHGFYTYIALFRVVPDYVVQFGIHNDSSVTKAWRDHPIPDEPVVKKNEAGTISFARGGPKTRTTQIFINLKSNTPRLDELDGGGVIGFPGIAQVISGMDIVLTFYDQYGNEPSRKQGEIYSQGNAYFKANYP
jgi:cyclophilin family peptidyl-prolyl cis-trans isomerase